jgi:hypothetical protein
MPDINFTDFFDITEIDTTDYGQGGFTSLSPDEFGISAPENMDVEPNNLSCQDYVNQWCALNPELCQVSLTGGVEVGYANKIEFENSYPNCSGTGIEQENLNLNNMNNKDIWNVKSPNFLGGNNVQSAILIVLGLLILASVTRGNIIKGIGTAVRDTVK